MTGELVAGDSPPDEQRSSRRARWKEKLNKTRDKFKKQDDKGGEQDYKLPDDVNTFLQAGRPSTSSADALPAHPLPTRQIQVRRIDVSSSQRWTSQRDTTVDNSRDLLAPEQNLRSQSQGAIARKKFRPRNLSVSFQNAPPIIIGEGGDDAESPPMAISQRRARSVSPMPSGSRRREATPDRRLPTNRRPVPEPEYGTSHSSPEECIPRRLDRVQTGGLYLASQESQSSVNQEFEMSLQSGNSSSAPGIQAPTPLRHAIRPPEPLAVPEAQADTSHAHPTQRESTGQSLKPAMASSDLRTQFAEGRALRAGHHRDLSSSSFIAENSPDQPNLPPLEQLQIGEPPESSNNLKDVFLPNRPDSGKDEN